jgi:hypothetical protein
MKICLNIYINYLKNDVTILFQSSSSYITSFFLFAIWCSNGDNIDPAYLDYET